MVHFTKVQKEEIMAKNSTQFWKTNNWSRLSWHRKVINWLSSRCCKKIWKIYRYFRIILTTNYYLFIHYLSTISLLLILLAISMLFVFLFVMIFIPNAYICPPIYPPPNSFFFVKWYCIVLDDYIMESLYYGVCCILLDDVKWWMVLWSDSLIPLLTN